MNALAERLAAIQTARPFTIVAIAFALAAASLPLVAKLELRGDISALLPDDQQSVVDMHRIEGRFEGKSTFTIALGAETRAQIPALERAARAMAERIEAEDLPEVATVEWNVRELVEFVEEHRYLYAPMRDLEEVESALEARLEWERARANPFYVDLEGEPPEDVEALGDRLQQRAEEERARRVVDPEGYFVHRSLPLVVVFVRTHAGTGDALAAEDLLERVREIEASMRHDGLLDGIRVDYGGDTMDILEEVRALVTEVALAIVATVVLVLLAVYVFFRRVRAIPLLALALVPPVIVTFALAQPMVGFLNTSTAFLGSIVVGNGINPNIIWLARYFEARRAGESVRDAIATSHRSTWAATLTASLAAGLAYGSLVITDFRGFRDFGLIGAVGMALSWLAAFLLLPALAALGERLLPGRDLRGSYRNPFGAAFAWLALGAPRAVVIASVVASFASLALVVEFVIEDPFEYDFRNLQSERDPNSRTAWVNLRQGEIVSQAATGSSIAVLLPSAEMARKMEGRDRDCSQGAAPRARTHAEHSRRPAARAGAQDRSARSHSRDDARAPGAREPRGAGDDRRAPSSGRPVAALPRRSSRAGDAHVPRD